MGFFNEWKSGTTSLGHGMAYVILVLSGIFLIIGIITFIILLAVYNPKPDDEEALSKGAALGITGGITAFFIIIFIVFYIFKDNKTFDLLQGAGTEANLVGSVFRGV